MLIILLNKVLWEGNKDYQENSVLLLPISLKLLDIYT